MWKQNLNLETEIVVKEAAEVDKARSSGDFDLVRRNVVLPTSDEAASLMAIFDTRPRPSGQGAPTPSAQQTPAAAPHGPSERSTEPPSAEPHAGAEPLEPVILNEDDAVYELRAIPLYFPTSFALVKPYVDGFETNSLDVITLANVSIDSDWRPQNAAQ
jgi:hypothetical protein